METPTKKQIERATIKHATQDRKYAYYFAPAQGGELYTKTTSGEVLHSTADNRSARIGWAETKEQFVNLVYRELIGRG